MEKYFGFTDYKSALQIQWQYHQSVLKGELPYAILGFEHPEVITLGKRASRSEVLKTNTIPVYSIERGGQATLHSPGQLVIYPIFPIQQLGVRNFVCELLKSSQNTLKKLGILVDTPSENAIGLYVNAQKLLSLGIQVKQGVSLHGLSINVCNDLSLFQNLKVCGNSHQILCSLQSLGVSKHLEEIYELWIKDFLLTLSPAKAKLHTHGALAQLVE